MVVVHFTLYSTQFERLSVQKWLFSNLAAAELVEAAGGGGGEKGCWQERKR